MPSQSVASEAEAVAQVIRAAGFDAMATEYVAEPHKRERIRVFMTKVIRREHGAVKAERFASLAFGSASHSRALTARVHA